MPHLLSHPIYISAENKHGLVNKQMETNIFSQPKEERKTSPTKRSKPILDTTFLYKLSPLYNTHPYSF